MLVHYSILQSQRIADFLIVTATKRETNALLNIMEPISDMGILEVSFNGLNYNIGKLGLYNIIHCQCSNMGAVSPGASLVTVDEAIKVWPCVKGVIMVGIAFGMYPVGENAQKYGTVLVCEKLYPYESQRVSSSSVEYRSSPVLPDDYLLAAFRKASINWEGNNYQNECVKVEVCPIVTGEKLVDRLEYREELAREYPDARGGEMEGQGLATACERLKKPWILVKSICDFADGNKGENKHEKQDSAANLAFSLCRKVFESEDFLKDLLQGEGRCVFTFAGNAYERKLVLFRGYNIKCEPFYLQREFDKCLVEIIRTHGCWLYGTSGVGKSVALSRLLVFNEIPFISIDLSTCVGTSAEDMFIAIYESICEKVGEPPLQTICSFRCCVREIMALLEKYYAGKNIVLFIDEIPLDADDTNFRKFIDEFVAFIISLGQCQYKVDVKFVLSSLESPASYLHRFQEKLMSFLKVVHMYDWTDEECLSLVEMLTNMLGLKWDDDYKHIDYIREMGNSPRKIKDVLNQALATDRMYITYDVVKKLLH